MSVTVKVIGVVGVLNRVVISGMAEMSGGSLTARIDRSKDSLANPPAPSVTLIMMTTDPDISGAGVTVTVRSAPESLKLIWPSGTRSWLEELPDRARSAAAVSTSLIVKLI